MLSCSPVQQDHDPIEGGDPRHRVRLTTWFEKSRSSGSRVSRLMSSGSHQPSKFGRLFLAVMKLPFSQGEGSPPEGRTSVDSATPLRTRWRLGSRQGPVLSP